MNENDPKYTELCSERTLQWNKQGFFLGFADQAIEVIGEAWIKKSFGKLQTDSERIKAIWSNQSLRKYLDKTFSGMGPMCRKKDLDVAQTKRNDGEKAYLYEEFYTALQLLNQSIIRAPVTAKTNDPRSDFEAPYCLALAFQSRAAVLLALKRYTKALEDLQLSLKYGLPDKMHGYVYWKMAICYKALKDENRTKVCSALAEKMLSKNATALKQLQEDMLKEFTEFEDLPQHEPPKLTPSPHPSMPGVSSYLGVKEKPDAGRFVVANECIPTGAVLAAEQPYVSALLPECFGSHCNHCFKRLFAPVGCPDCSGVAYCDQACQKEASKYHKIECRVMQLLIGSGMSALCHAAVRAVTQVGLNKIDSILKDQKIQDLCTNSRQRTSKDFFYRGLMALFLTRCLQIAGFFTNKNYSEVTFQNEELSVAEILLKLLQQLQFNAHEIYETRRTGKHRFKGSKAVYVGVALYPSVALFNHECYPAVTRYFVGKTIVLRAARQLQRGDLVSENYGPVFINKPMQERTRTLKARYWFQCQCLPCLENWPLLTNLDNSGVRLKCSNLCCKQLFSPMVKQEVVTCPQCKQKTSIKDQKACLTFCESQYQQGIFKMDSQKPEDAIPILCTALDLFHRTACPPHKDTHLAQETLRVCFADKGNVSVVLE